MSDSGCFYLVNGERRPLRRLPTARTVSVARDNHIAVVGARLVRSSRLSLEPSVPSSRLMMRGDPNKLDEIRSYRDVWCTRSVFLDDQGFELALTDEVLIGFNKDLGPDDRARICSQYDCLPIGTASDIWTVQSSDPNDDAPLHIANALSAESGVEFAEPNALQAVRFASAATPGDPLFANQWHLANTGQAGGVSGADVSAREAWEITRGSVDVRVVVHDSGVDITHPDLQQNLAPGWDFDNNDNNSSNDHGPHGTACAGVIAATGNQQGVVGIAPGCRVTPLRAAGAHTWSEWADTFAWAALNGEVISCSWSISANSVLSAAIRTAANDGRSGLGIPSFFATGNEYQSSIAYPARLNEAIAVGASTNEDVRSPYSNTGAGIDFVAPSSGGTLRIETTDIQGALGYNNGGDYCKADGPSGFGGTSSATPLAAGVAALMLSVNPKLRGQEVRDILRETAEKIDTAKAGYDETGWSPEYGFGRIDAARAVAEAERLASPPRGRKGKY